MRKYPLTWLTIATLGILYAMKLVKKMQVKEGKTSVERFEEEYGPIE